MKRKVRVVTIVQELNESGAEFANRISIDINDIHNLDEANQILHLSFTTSSNGRQTFNMVYS